MKKEKFIKIYDGASYCIVGACPIVEFSPDKNIVKISDSKKTAKWAIYYGGHRV